MVRRKVTLGTQTVEGEEVFITDSCFHEVEAYIEENICNPAMLSLHVLAAKFNYSPSQFSRRFVAVTGESVKKYVTKVKVNKAKELLRTVNLSITAIAYQLGYTTPFYFTNVFTKHFGFSPTAYRSKFSKFKR